jgi:hypothetical protein
MPKACQQKLRRSPGKTIRSNSILEQKHPDFRMQTGSLFFQGSFESFEHGSNGYRSYLKHRFDHDDLDKRTKETRVLIEKGGFVCLLLTEAFIDFGDRESYADTDLSKRLIRGSQRADFGRRKTFVDSKVNELQEFFSMYGAAWTSITPGYGDIGTKTLASVGRTSVSIIIDGNIFAIPTLIPRESGSALEDYFRTLVEGIVPLWQRLKDDLPGWATEYLFADEAIIRKEHSELSVELAEIEAHLNRVDRLKRVLVSQGEPLVDAVVELLEEALRLRTKREESFREDLALLDAKGKAVALAEIKGVSKGVTREYVNQADSHRERNGLPPEFPSLLIINTAMRNSTSIAGKDQVVAPEQVQHAARNNVLIIRTLDLLNLASLHTSGKLTSKEVIDLLTLSRGWLRVGNVPEVLTN